MPVRGCRDVLVDADNQLNPRTTRTHLCVDSKGTSPPSLPSPRLPVSPSPRLPCVSARLRRYLFDPQTQPSAQTARKHRQIVEQQPGGRLPSPVLSTAHDPRMRPASLMGTDVPLGQRSWKTWFVGGPERRSVKLRLKTPNEAWSYPEPRPATYRRTGPKDELCNELVLKVVDVVPWGPADGILQIGDEIVGVGKTRWGCGETKVRKKIAAPQKPKTKNQTKN